MNSTSPLLAVRNLSVEFHSRTSGSLTITRALNNVSFSLQRGTTIGIVGESGSGKSVTSLMIMQLLRSATITHGDIVFHPKDASPIILTKAHESVVRELRGNKIAMIFQEPMTSLNPLMRCGDQVSEAIMLHSHVTRSEAQNIALQLFHEVQLPIPEEMLKRFPHQLSGGQRQRVMIAIALSCNPDVLIADEPTTALDVTVQKAILDLIRDLQQKRGMSILFITHDLGVIADIADDIAVMYRGSLVEYGTAQSILSNPQHPYTQGLLACRPHLNMPKGIVLPTVRDFMDELPDGTIIAKQSEPTAIPKQHPTQDAILSSEAPVMLDVRNLCVHYPRSQNSLMAWFKHSKQDTVFKAVDNISFQLRQGETLGLVGESGCGKTTTGRAILRLIQPTSGSILFSGTDIVQLPQSALTALRRDMQIIFQDPFSALNPRISIGSAIQEVLSVHRLYENSQQRKDAVCTMLEKVGLRADHYTRYPHEFSGGQRQRICIARALILQPKLLICDESVSALDVSVQAQVLNLLAELRAEMNLTCIFISHDLSVVKFISDRIAVMQRGAIVEINTADEIYRNPYTAYTRNLIEAIPQIP